MQVLRFSSLDQLAPYAAQWDAMATGVPFRGWTWLSTWWRHYGSTDSLYPRLMVLGVRNAAKKFIGFAPWYLDRSTALGRVIRWLGSGEVCSDYLSLVCQPEMENAVADALAEYLLDPAGADDPPHLVWDLLELTGVDTAERSVTRLADGLALGGLTVDIRPGVNCWRLDLPGDWEAYLACLSKSHRRQIRRLQRDVFDTSRAALHTVQRADELPQALETLIDLHKRRRHALGQPGSFASARFTEFHRDVMPRLLESGQLDLHWLELDGRPVAAEYLVTQQGIAYAYQAGVDPEVLEEEPGRLITSAILHRAIQEGYRAVDFLRGDEPYKAHFRAACRASVEIRVVADHAAARWRHRLWSAGKTIKRWARRPALEPQTAQPVYATEPS